VKWLVPSQQKLVSFLQGHLGDYSGKFLRKLLEANLCRINGRVERFGSRVVKGGDAVELAPSWKSLLTPKSATFETFYEDEFLKIVGKPAGWICTDKEALQTFGQNHYLVHRLDKDTTGLPHGAFRKAGSCEAVSRPGRWDSK
jgi:23S rRNA-/tRNA-specific pseudouridylate synthase